MTDADQRFECDACGTVATSDDAIRTEPMGDLDPTTWQTLCCPNCGRRLETVFVGLE